jgi:hypothetical protein
MIPKRLWFLWLQGIEQAPPLVRICLDSWHRWNPDWQIEVLDWSRLESFLPEYPLWCERWAAMNPGALSDLIRVNLLYHHGGVWADATCLCRKPLDVWLHHLARTGFFAFAEPAPDRMLASWFLAANRHAPIIAGWRDLCHGYWEEGTGRRVIPIDDPMHSPGLAEQRSNRLLWFDEAHASTSDRYPYFWLHYLFEKMTLDPDSGSRWRSVPKVTADIPHRLQQLGLDRVVDTALRQEFRSGIAPIYKLTNKTDCTIADRDKVLGYCLDPENW